MDSEELELKVTFFPPLYLQRRIWILDSLRQQAVTSVLDVGCGEGELLDVLCQPAPWLPTHPDCTDIASPDEIANLHVKHVAGLDISADLEFACRAVVPSTPSHGVTRWEPLEANVWKGGLEYPNAEFVGIECIVATEVIEHLTEDILSEFAPVILGVYLPRLLLITTPSYTFNARFTAPDAPASARNGYPDPTGRTSRIFRHHDHKFEWTVEEFKQWCDAAALEWGYTVDVSTVGKASEVDEWGRDDALGGASQIAMFKRIDNPELEQNRAEKSKVVVERASRRTKHELLTTHLHAAHPRSQKPGSLQEIGESVKLKMEAYREAFMGLQEIWFEQDIAILCGGWIELLVEAVKAHEKLKLHWNESEKRTNWQIELTDGVQQQRVFWPPKEDENSLDYIPPDYFPEEVNNVRSWETESSGIDGDVSAGNSGDEDVDFWGHRERPTWAMKDHAETVGVDQSSTEGESDDQWKGEARITQGGTWGCSAEETSSVDDEKSDEESA